MRTMMINADTGEVIESTFDYDSIAAKLDRVINMEYQGVYKPTYSDEIKRKLLDSLIRKLTL